MARFNKNSNQDNNSILYNIGDIVRVSWFNHRNINLIGTIQVIQDDNSFVILYQNGTYQNNVKKQDLQRPFNKGDYVLAFKKDNIVKPDSEQPVKAKVIRDNQNNTFDLNFLDTNNHNQVQTVKGIFIQDIIKSRKNISTVGSLVIVNWKGLGYKYFATVIQEYHNKVDVMFSLDSFIEKGISKSDISNPFPNGTKILGNFKGLGSFYKGKISSFNQLNGSYNIDYNDGDKEFCVPINYIKLIPPIPRVWDDKEIYTIKGELILKKIKDTPIPVTFTKEIKDKLEKFGSIRTIKSITQKCRSIICELGNMDIADDNNDNNNNNSNYNNNNDVTIISSSNIINCGNRSIAKNLKRKRNDDINTSSHLVVNNSRNTRSMNNTIISTSSINNNISSTNNQKRLINQLIPLSETIKNIARNHVNSHIGQQSISSLIDIIDCGLSNNELYKSWKVKTNEFYAQKNYQYSPETYESSSTIINNYITEILVDLVDSEKLFRLSIGISNFNENVKYYQQNQNVSYFTNKINDFIDLINSFIPQHFVQLNQVNAIETICDPTGAGFQIIKDHCLNIQQTHHTNSTTNPFLDYVNSSYFMIRELNKL